MTNIAYYISSHGFGHLTRAVEIIRQLPADFTVLAKSTAPHGFLKQETGRSIPQFEDKFDCGCHQLDAMAIDWRRTFRDYAVIAQENRARLEDEIDFLTDNNIDVVVSDVPALPLVAASKAGVPSVVIANFTWVDIYRYALEFYPEADDLVEELIDQYSHADLLLRTPLGAPMDYFPTIHDTPVVARRGVDRRAEVCERFRLDASRRLGLIYVGQWGVDDMGWENLAGLKDYQFITMSSPSQLPDNVFAAPQGSFRHEDLTASVDVVIAKPGYGICGECLSASKPWLYCGREEFAEFPPMERDMRKWGGAIRMTDEHFQSFNLRPYLSQIENLAIDANAFAVNGAEVCARVIQEMAQGVAS